MEARNQYAGYSHWMVDDLGISRLDNNGTARRIVQL